MSINQELPDGITYNTRSSNEIELDCTNEVINSTKCNKCDLCLESILINISGRHEGYVKATPSGNIVWKNSLPKDRVRSIKILDEALIDKLDKHKERHKND